MLQGVSCTQVSTGSATITDVMAAAYLLVWLLLCLIMVSALLHHR